MTDSLTEVTLHFEINKAFYDLTRKLTELAYTKESKGEQFAILDCVERIREMEEEVMSLLD